MTQQKKKTAPKKTDPFELATFLTILNATSTLVTLSLSIAKILEYLKKKEGKKDSKKWEAKREEIQLRHDDYKRLVKEILLTLNELESGFGEKEIKAGNLLFLIDRNQYYRLLDLKRDLTKLTGELAETINELDKFVIENNLPEFKLEKEDELLAGFDRLMSLWGKGTFNDAARELKGLNRVIEKRLGHEGHYQG
jgi:hypothetical protein